MFYQASNLIWRHLTLLIYSINYELKVMVLPNGVVHFEHVQDLFDFFSRVSFVMQTIFGKLNF